MLMTIQCLKADSIKYVIIFRNMLSREVLVACLPLLVKHLTAKSHVVHSYSANCLEKLFTLKSPGGGAPISKTEVQPFLEEMLINLFNLLQVPGSEENEYVYERCSDKFNNIYCRIYRHFYKPVQIDLFELSIMG
ncbi:Exportin-2 [Desmophyllum pertusum]|uniref:Exportin-2 n=1 Tax=Desmophyllum pertusum TaxID=174260 RepID=A0A9X0CS00_9CNID|nr:Exportin-2 [Desmophyllum pertusum]